MKYGKFDNVYTLRIDKGEEIVSALLSFCDKEKIKFAKVSAIGAADLAVCSVFDTVCKTYKELIYSEPMEILAVNGNVTEKDGVAYVHLHAVFGREDGEAVGGHLVSAKVSATCEMFVEPINGNARRVYCAETGLNLVEFPENA